VAVVGVLVVVLAAVLSSPDRKAISLTDWANAAPNDVVATAAGELAGTTTSASYGAPYNRASDGQKLGPLPLQRWGHARSVARDRACGDRNRRVVRAPMSAHRPMIAVTGC
jgi:hypothetical protein